MSWDIPSRINLRLMHDAKQWEKEANVKRPYRSLFFNRIENEINRMSGTPLRILELGSGPGYLAEHLLESGLKPELVLLDFSRAMHRLAKYRLRRFTSHIKFIERNFKKRNWQRNLGQFHVIVTIQAVHELRHRKHAPRLFSEVRELLLPGGIFLFCDHFYGTNGMSNRRLFMTIRQRSAALERGGFTRTACLLCHGTLALHRADCPA